MSKSSSFTTKMSNCAQCWRPTAPFSAKPVRGKETTPASKQVTDTIKMLPAEGMDELAAFVEYLKYKYQRQSAAIGREHLLDEPEK